MPARGCCWRNYDAPRRACARRSAGQFNVSANVEVTNDGDYFNNYAGRSINVNAERDVKTRVSTEYLNAVLGTSYDIILYVDRRRPAAGRRSNDDHRPAVPRCHRSVHTEFGTCTATSPRRSHWFGFHRSGRHSHGDRSREVDRVGGTSIVPLRARRRCERGNVLLTHLVYSGCTSMSSPGSSRIRSSMKVIRFRRPGQFCGIDPAQMSSRSSKCRRLRAYEAGSSFPQTASRGSARC